MKHLFILFLIFSNVSYAQISGKFIKLNKCTLQISDDEETKYSGKHFLNLKKIERFIVALNHVELMLRDKRIVIYASEEEKTKIVDAMINCT